MGPRQSEQSLANGGRPMTPERELLRATVSLLRRCLSHGLLRAEAVELIAQAETLLAQPADFSRHHDFLGIGGESVQPATAPSSTAKVPDDAVLVRLPITDAMSERGLAVMRQAPMSEGGVNSVFLAMLAVAQHAVLDAYTHCAEICGDIARAQLRCAVGDQWSGPDIAKECSDEILATRDKLRKP